MFVVVEVVGIASVNTFKRVYGGFLTALIHVEYASGGLHVVGDILDVLLGNVVK